MFLWRAIAHHRRARHTGRVIPIKAHRGARRGRARVKVRSTRCGRGRCTILRTYGGVHGVYYMYYTTQYPGPSVATVGEEMPSTLPNTEIVVFSSIKT